MPNVLDVILVIRNLLYMLELITVSDTNIVDTNGRRAGIQGWQKKVKHRLSTV
jgi:hypothetical protein